MFPDVPSALLSKNPLRHLKFYGPGAIIASVTIGGGETVFASRGGAIFGYALLWCFVLGGVLKGIQVYSTMRVMTLTGLHPVDYWVRMKGPRAWFPFLMILVSLITIPSMFSALPKFLATLIVSLFEVRTERYEDTLNLLASAILVGCAALALRSSYRALEWTMTAITFLFAAFIVAAFLAVRPDTLAILKGVFIISVPDYPDWIRETYPAIAARPPWLEILTAAGIIGGNAVDYTAYLSFIREKRWGLASPSSSGTPIENPPSPAAGDVAKGMNWLRAPRFDALVSFGFVTLFTVVFLVLGAELLAPEHAVPAGPALLTVQARFMTELHPSLFPIYVVGIIMVFFGTIYGAMELHTRALFECGRVTYPKLAANISQPLRSFRLFVVIYAVSSGLLLIWSGWDPVAILTPSVLLGGLLAAGMWCFTMLWVDRRFLPAAFRMGSALKLALWVSAILLFGAGVTSCYYYVLSFFQ